MPNYTAPVEDMMFLFDKLRNNRNYNEIEKYKDVNTELVKDILLIYGGLRHKEQRYTLKLLADENPYIHSFGMNQFILSAFMKINVFL